MDLVSVWGNVWRSWSINCLIFIPLTASLTFTSQRLCCSLAKWSCCLQVRSKPQKTVIIQGFSMFSSSSVQIALPVSLLQELFPLVLRCCSFHSLANWNLHCVFSDKTNKFTTNLFLCWAHSHHHSDAQWSYGSFKSEDNEEIKICRTVSVRLEVRPRCDLCYSTCSAALKAGWQSLWDVW